jgi:hypothetical protein
MIDCSVCSEHENCQDIECPLHRYWTKQTTDRHDIEEED